MLWLGAITIITFLIGFGILALSGEIPQAKDQDLSPFRHTAFLSPGKTIVPLDGAGYGDVTLTLGAGELRIQGSAPDNVLMDASVFSKAPEWQPDLVQSVNGSTKTAVLTDKGHKVKELFSMDSPNSWTIALNNGVPLNLKVNVGAGDCRLDLEELTLKSLDIHNGAGDTTIALGRNQRERFDAVIRNGIGDLTLRVPRESNTRIRAENGIGEISNNGLVQDGDIFVTPGFNPAIAVNEITLNQGVGSISLETL
ncbi:MAG TPA: toast rack family protein [Methanoregula sp.]|nr:toast rack family protein [Methanoregula sp.]